jgi:hypothetical protein
MACSLIDLRMISHHRRETKAGSIELPARIMLVFAVKSQES